MYYLKKGTQKMEKEKARKEKELKSEMRLALKQAVAVISQHYPAGATCCEKKIQFITDTIKKAGGK
jgi:hypothetical protein